MKRVFLIVLDSVGMGLAKDAKDFGDEGANTLLSCSKSPYFAMPNMRELGYFNIDGMELSLEGKNCLGEDKSIANSKIDSYKGAVARLNEASAGKDTTIGHWEIAGVISDSPLPTYPNGFPIEVIDKFKELTGRGILCNLPYSGTEVINVYGDEHVKTGDLIVYTSADSVFQIAAHEDIVPVEELYDYCKKARAMLTGKHGVGRVIARPFTGSSGKYVRTSNRHDFSIEPPRDTMLDMLMGDGFDTLAVGKIYDIFAGVGISDYVRTTSNEDGIDKTLEMMDRDFEGLCFVNLVDYDMLYGHRRDRDGYAKALTYFDTRLPELLSKMRSEDVLIITADHGCDPDYSGTDHTRECVPLLMYGNTITPNTNLGVKDSYSYIAGTILEYFNNL